MSRAFSSLVVNFCKRSVRFLNRAGFYNGRDVFPICNNRHALGGVPVLRRCVGCVRLFLFGIEMVNDVEHHEALHTVIPVVAGVFGTGPGVGTAALVENV